MKIMHDSPRIAAGIVSALALSAFKIFSPPFKPSNTSVTAQNHWFAVTTDLISAMLAQERYILTAFKRARSYLPYYDRLR